MIIKSFELQKLKSFNSNFHLIYGNNEGIKEDIINNIYINSFEGDVLKYDEQDILSNKDDFISSLLTSSFLSKKLIIISRASEKILNIIKEVYEEINETTIVIKSRNLKKNLSFGLFLKRARKLYALQFMRMTQSH